MNNDTNNNGGRKKPFEVHIEDDGFLNPETLDKITPVNGAPKKKFEVHIDDDAPLADVDEHTPQYKGEIYFSNRKPHRRTVPQPQAQSGKRSSSQRKKIQK